jgi:hypothetical protein
VHKTKRITFPLMALAVLFAAGAFPGKHVCVPRSTRAFEVPEYIT